MQNNILGFTTNGTDPAQEKRESIYLLISSRRAARVALHEIDNIAESNRVLRRLAKKHRASGNALLVRNAEVLEAKIAEGKNDLKLWNQCLVCIGAVLSRLSEDIDRVIPTDDLFDILEVNRVDRARVGAKAGIRDIVLIYALEDSATHRGSDFKEGPLFEAMNHYMMRMIETNPELNKTVMDGLFGKGGMFEFIPTYSRQADGTFARNPPKLRLADDSVDVPGRA